MTLVGRGGYSSVWRPKSLAEGATPHVIKRPKQDITPKQRAQVVGKYKHQKELLDHLHEKVPKTASRLFNRILKIREDGSVVMTDLGNTTLYTMLGKQYLNLYNDMANVWIQLKLGVVSMILSGVAHRDIKDGNIMVWKTPSGKFQVVFIDFSDSITKKEVEELNTFVLFGTKDYMSPELLKRRCDRDKKKGSWDEYVANDLWALGILLYRMLYNKRPIDMFRQMDPDFWAPILPECKSQNEPVKLLLGFYNDMREYPAIYESLFLPVPGKEKFVQEAKQLLSLDPKPRLAWLDATTRSFLQWQARKLAQKQQKQQQKQQKQQPQQKQQSHTHKRPHLSSSSQQQRQTKRAKMTAMRGVQMLLRAASALQEKKNKTPQK